MSFPCPSHVRCGRSPPRDAPATPISRTYGLHPGFTTSCCPRPELTAACDALRDRLKGRAILRARLCDLLGILSDHPG